MKAIRHHFVEAIARAPEVMPRYTGSVILPGCGHWVQQERPEETNQHILDFLHKIA